LYAIILTLRPTCLKMFMCMYSDTKNVDGVAEQDQIVLVCECVYMWYEYD